MTFVPRRAGAMFTLPIGEDEYIEVHGDAKDGEATIVLRLFSRSTGHVLDVPMSNGDAAALAMMIQTLTADAGLVAGNQRMKLQFRSIEGNRFAVATSDSSGRITIEVDKT